MKEKKEKIETFCIPALNDLPMIHGYDILNTFPVHFHQSFCIGIIEEGRRVIRYRGKSTHMRAGDIFIIHPLEPHSCETYKNIRHSYKILCPSREIINDIRSNLSKEMNCEAYFSSIKIKDISLFEKIKEFHLMSLEKENINKLISLYSSILNELVNNHSINISTKKIKKNEHDSVKMVREYIQRHFEENLHLEFLANLAGMSQFYFCRVFQKENGVSPHAYHIQLRVKNAQKLLENGANLAVVALDCGFTDQSHFTRFFKKSIGVTPGNYSESNKFER